MDLFSQIADKMTRMMGGGSQDSGVNPIQDASDQSPDELKLVAYIRDFVDEVRLSGSRVALEATWLTNAAYLKGFSGYQWDSVKRTFQNVDPYATRSTRKSRGRVNKLLPMAQNRAARMCKSPPRYDVRPKSNSVEDKDASRLALEVLDDVMDKAQFEDIRIELAMAVQTYGYCFVQPCWDPTLGKTMINPETGISSHEGDLRLDIVTPFEAFTDPQCKRMRDLKKWSKVKVRPLSYFRERFPERGSLVKEEDAYLLSAQYEMRINSLSSSGMTGSSTNGQMKNSAIEMVYYEAPSADYPKGRMCTQAAGILLEDKELPIGELDLIKFDDILVSGSFASEAVITHARPIQDKYNLLSNKVEEWTRLLLGGKYRAGRGSNLGEEAIDDSNGEVVLYDPVPGCDPPEPMAIPLIPQYVYEEFPRIDQELDYIFGINEISRGVLPSKQIPAELASFLQEQDETRIGIQTNRNELGFAQLSSKILKYVAQYYEMPRLLKVAGDGLGYAVKEFKGADLADNHDVICIQGSTVPSSKVIRDQKIMGLYQMGILGQPGDPKLMQKLLKSMEFGDLPEIWKTQALDEGQIKKTINSIESGQMPTLHEFDNHSLFIQELNDYRKTDKFEQLDKMKQALLNYVVEWHIQAQVSLTAPQIPQQQMLSQQMVNTMHKVMPPGSPPPTHMVPQHTLPTGPPEPQQVPQQMPQGA